MDLNWLTPTECSLVFCCCISCYENPFVLAIFIKFNMNQRFRGLRVRSSDALINEVIGRQISDERIIHKTLSMHFVKKSY